MLLKNLITHLQELEAINGGLLHITVQVETEDCTILTNDLRIIREGDQIHIRNF